MLPTDVLTDLDIVRILVEKRQGAKMAGHIRAKGKCPVCGKPFRCDLQGVMSHAVWLKSPRRLLFFIPRLQIVK